MSTSLISPGAAAPPFTLQALGSGRTVSHVSPAPLLLVFHDQTMVEGLLGPPALGQSGR